MVRNMQGKDELLFIFLTKTLRSEGVSCAYELCLSCFVYNITIGINGGSGGISEMSLAVGSFISQEVSWNCGRLGHVGMFVVWSTVFVKTFLQCVVYGDDRTVPCK